jgi:catechol 2,3-dioxygenase-like lactoylglutathione lyase family enzyme
MHVSLAVRDIDKSSRAFAELFRLPLPQVRPGRVARGSSVGDLLVCSFHLPNFFIEFIQHVDGVTPYGEFTRRHGDSIHHVAFHVGDEGFAKRVEWLEQHGGLCVAGGAHAHYADIDLQEQLGATVELLAADDRGYDWNAAWSSPSDAEDGSNISNHQVTHVGVLVHDVQRVAHAYATIFGVEPPPVRLATPRFARGARAASGACAKVASIRQPNVAIQVIEPVGRSPLRDYLEEHGNSVHHIGLNLRDRLDDTISHMEECGGRRILGRDGDPYAQMDFRSRFGFVVELTGNSRRSQLTREPPRSWAGAKQRVPEDES